MKPKITKINDDYYIAEAQMTKDEILKCFPKEGKEFFDELQKNDPRYVKFQDEVKKICENCRYWDRYTIEIYEEVKKNLSKYGFNQAYILTEAPYLFENPDCKRYPERIKKSAIDTCGEFKDRYDLD